MSQSGWSTSPVFVKAFIIVNVNRCLKLPRTTYQYCKYNHASTLFVDMY